MSAMMVFFILQNKSTSASSAIASIVYSILQKPYLNARLSRVTCQSSTASVRWHHGSSSEHCYIHCFPDFTVTGFRPELLSFIACKMIILRSHTQYVIEIGSKCNYQDSQGSVNTYLRW